jgi:nucleotide-binding universal stress UspA family protein
MGAESALAPSSPAVFADILCAVDGTRGSLAAVRQAAALIGRDGCLTLLAVRAVEGSGRFRGAAIAPERVERVLDIAAHLVRDAGARCTRVADPAAPSAKAILDQAAHHELLAIGAPAMSWMGELFVGGVVSSALRSLPSPLLLARPAPAEQPFGRRLLVASDAQDGSDHLVDVAASLARRLGGGLMLVHAVGVESKVRPHRIERQVHTLEGALADACEVHVETGHAHEVIVQIAASAQASLIVIGARRPAGPRALGGVSEHVVHRAPCSVLVMPD